MTNTSNFFLRRKGLGLKSCAGIAEKMAHSVGVLRSDTQTGVQADLVIRWGCTATVKGNASSVLNEASAIHFTSDKARSRKAFADAGIAPRTWLDVHEFGSFEFGNGVDSLPEGWKVVVRPSSHQQGKNLHLCESFGEVVSACNLYEDYYISEFIPKVKEFRVVVVQGRVIFMYEKVPEDPSAVAWNHAQGSSSDNCKWSTWNMDAVKVAIQAMGMTDLDFGAVDVMVDKDGYAYVLEINTGPETTSPYRQSCFAKAFDYLIDHGRDKIPVVQTTDYRGYIHPAVSQYAVVS